MAKRFVDTELWDKEWFMKLSPKLKCLVKLVRDKCDLSGVWSPNWIIAKAYIGEEVNEADLLGVDGGRQFKKIDSGKILCIDFISFQYGKLSDRSPVHRKILSILDTHKIPYQYPINRVQEEEKEKEEEGDKEKVGVKASRFERFWIAYGVDIGRRSCESAWLGLSPQQQEKAIEHAPEFVKSTERRFLPNPYTYLTEMRFNDAIIDRREPKDKDPLQFLKK